MAAARCPGQPRQRRIATVGTRAVDVGMDRPGHSDRTEGEGGQREHSKKLLELLQRVAQVFAAIFRRLQAPRGVWKIGANLIFEGARFRRVYEFQMHLVGTHAALS